ncbi:hypothetical protein KQX54_019089 [Cotesia glomerata]|uniref:Uncharacterized protein n=1 Tax=Cotesia glomerata TaxID=32391 RepID=A0AAV7I7Z7_COTGL|nr:hypothetical protein KQX54_019089 [Cotesia glomerata]
MMDIIFRISSPRASGTNLMLLAMQIRFDLIEGSVGDLGVVGFGKETTNGAQDLSRDTSGEYLLLDGIRALRHVLYSTEARSIPQRLLNPVF